MSSLEANSGVTIATCDATDEESLHQALGNNHIAALISCIGQRDSAVANEEIYRTLCNGTINLYRAANACKASRFITIAGGIHKTTAGEVRCEMIRNAAREAALATIAQRESSENGNGGPTMIVVDSTVFFKDAATIFDIIAKSAEKKGQASLTLVEGSWEVRCNPISGRDLADRMVRLLVEDIPSGGRVTAGGPEELTFAELVDAAGDALGVGAVAHKTIPQWWARIILAGARLGSAFGSHKAMALQRFFSFLLVIGTDESPNSLVGEPGGHDAVTDFYKDLAAKRGQSTISEPEKVNLALDCEKFM
jgi:nucleoside-diphosphate-sugar epimerase